MLHDKLHNLILEETSNLKLPIQFRNTGSLTIAKGNMEVILGGNKVQVTIIVKTNSKGYWVCFGGCVRMVKTIDQVNRILDVETSQQELIAERDKLIDRLTKSGLKRLDISQIIYPPNLYAAFKISDTQTIQIVKYSNWKPLDNKIVVFNNSAHHTTMECHPKNFNKTLKKFLSTQYRDSV